MLKAMIKTKGDDGEVLTKGFFREAMDELIFLISKSFEGMESRMAKQDDLLVLTERVKEIEKIVKRHDKELVNIHEEFSTVISELKAIRERLDRIEKSDFRPEVIALDHRIRKLEKKAGLQ
jgi:uncharacterized coiled-coil protein SlyX